MKNFILPFFLLVTFSGYAQLSRPVLEDATTVFDCLNKDYQQNNDDLTAFSEAGKDLEKVMEIMEYYINTQNQDYLKGKKYPIDILSFQRLSAKIGKNNFDDSNKAILLLDINQTFKFERNSTAIPYIYKHSNVFNNTNPIYKDSIFLTKNHDADIKKIKSKINEIDLALDRIKPTISQSKTNHTAELLLGLERNKDFLTKTMNYLKYLKYYDRILFLDTTITKYKLHTTSDSTLSKNYCPNENRIVLERLDIEYFYRKYSSSEYKDTINNTMVEKIIIRQDHDKQLEIRLHITNGKNVPKNITLFNTYKNVGVEDSLKNIIEKETYKHHGAHPKLIEALRILKTQYDTNALRPKTIFSITSYNQKSFTALAGDALFSVIIEGLTEVIKERINNELATALVQSLVKVSTGEKNDSTMLYMLNTTLPTTMSFLQTDPGSLLTNPSIISTYVKNDLSDLANNLVNIRNDKKFRSFLRQIKLDEAQSNILIDALNTFNLINKSATINEFLWEVSKFESWKKMKINGIPINRQLSGLSLMADALMVRSGSNNFTFTSYDYFINYYSAPNFRSFYNYFLCVQNDAYYNDSPIIDYITRSDSTSDYLLKLLESYNKVNNLHTQILIAKKSNDKANLPIYIGDYATALADLVYNAVKENPTLDNDTIIKKLYNYTESVKEIISIYRDLNQKRYITAVNTAIKLPLRYMENPKDSASKLALKNYKLMLEYVGKPISFVLEMSQIQNKDEAKRVIKEFSLGTGSYKANRQNLFTVNLQANPGYVYAFSPNKAYKSAFGVTVPVGISLNWGLRHRQAYHATMSKENGIKNPSDFFGISVLIGIIDLTAPLMMSADSGASTNAQLRQLSVKNILSPSLYLSLGIPRTPLAISGGIQYTPDSGIPHIPPGVVRANIGLTVDLPLFRFKVIPFKKPY